MNDTLTLNDITAAIMTLDHAELKEVYAAAKARRTALGQTLKMQFRSGQRVEFTARHGQTLKGNVIKRMQKNIKVQVDDGRVWHVDPSLLREVEDDR